LPVVETAKVPMIGPNQTNNLESEINYDYFFATWHDNRVGIRELLRFAEANDLKRVAIMRPMAAGFWQFTRDLFVEYAPDYGVEIVGDIDVGNFLETDFRTHITKVMKNNPDALFMVTASPGQCTLLKQFKELGYTVPVLSTEAAGDYVSLEVCPELLEEFNYFSTPEPGERYREFVEAFENEYGDVPQLPSVLTAYDAMMVLAQALEESELEGGEVLQSALANTTAVPGVSQDLISFDGRGFVSTSEDVFEMRAARGGEFVKVDTINRPLTSE